MSIHHATLAKAAKAQLSLIADPDEEGCFNIACDKPSFIITGGTNAAALLAVGIQVKMMLAEYPGLDVTDNQLSVDGSETDPIDLTDTSVAALEQWFADLEDDDRALLSGGEPEDEVDEDTASGSVVPQRYKQMYLERGDPNHCGDWLALVMRPLDKIIDAETGAERINLDKTEALAYANGVDRIAPHSGNRGFEGRYRMTVGNMMRRKVADAQLFVIPPAVSVSGKREELVPPADFCAKWATKPRKSKAAKKAEAEAAAEIAAPAKRTRKSKAK